jgi:uncharacterized protein YxjI
VERLIESHERILVKQVKEWGEILLGFESRNRFEIVTEAGEVLGYAAEEGGGFGTMILRNLLGRCRACKVHIYEPDGGEIASGVKPFRFYFHRMELFERGEKIGAIQRRFSIFHRKFVMEGPDGSELLEIYSPLFRIWTFKLQRDGLEMGRISKKWGGLLKEMFTDADVFGIEFSHPDLPMSIKKLLLVAVFLVDFTCFEENTRQSGVFGSG